MPSLRWMLQQLGSGLDPKFGIEVGQWFVEQEHRRLADNRAADGDTLLLAAAEVFRLAPQEFPQPEGLGHLVGALERVRPGSLGGSQRKRDVLPHREVWIQRVVLEDHRDVAVARLQMGDVAVADGDRARGD